MWGIGSHTETLGLLDETPFGAADSASEHGVLRLRCRSPRGGQLCSG